MKNIRDNNNNLEYKMTKAMNIEDQLNREERIMMEKGFEIRRVGDEILDKLDDVMIINTTLA